MSESSRTRRSLRSQRKRIADMSKEELVKYFEEQEKSKFRHTDFFKRRLIIALLLFLLAVIVTPFVPTNKGSVTNEYSYILMIGFIGLLFAIDQLVLGWYYFSKDKKIGE